MTVDGTSRTERWCFGLGIVKKGRKVDPYVTMVPNPDDIPDEKSDAVKNVMSMWRVDKLKDLTYTQFWQLVRDGHIKQVTGQWMVSYIMA